MDMDGLRLMKRKMISVRIPILIWEKVEIASSFLGLNKTQYVILALSDRLNKDLKKLMGGNNGNKIN